MSPTPEASERARKAAFKAWETIRRKQAAKTKSEPLEVTELVEAEKTSPKTRIKKVTHLRIYPKDWKQIGIEIRERARNADGLEQCECRGECLKHRGRCEEINRTWAMHRRRKGKVKIRFTIAHLCHTPECDDKSHLRAMCEPCHLIYDLRCRQRGLCGPDAITWAMQQGQER
jgi:hypothetical protein